MAHRIAVIGTGDPEEGYGMAYRHARAYSRLDDCELVACADLISERRERFAREFDIPTEHVYEDADRLLTNATPDVVSVCVPPAAHADVVMACTVHDGVEAVHCEKPMAATWGDCQEMVACCDRADVQLSFNHQRRFAAPFRRAKTLLDEGLIGTLERIEVGGQNLYDYGSHLFDMCGLYTDQTPIEWVLAQIAYADRNVLFGMHNETQALARWRYESGVEGIASTGAKGAVDCQLRLVGSDGTIEISAGDGPALRLRRDGVGWEPIETGNDGIYRLQQSRLTAVADAVLDRVPVGPDEAFQEPTYVDRAIEDVVQSVAEDREPETAAWKALQATELIFACWESARSRGRVDLPLSIEDNPLEAMVEAGDFSPSEPQPTEQR